MSVLQRVLAMEKLGTTREDNIAAAKAANSHCQSSALEYTQLLLCIDCLRWREQIGLWNYNNLRRGVRIKMQVYEHKVQYYETDQMAIVHHSNYIRWFEEARTDILEKIGFGYEKLEAAGIISPVLAVNAEYKSMTYYADTVCIETYLSNYNGVKMTVCYKITDKVTGEVRCVGESKHCFLNREGHPLSLKRSFPEIDKAFRTLLINIPNDL